jgi:hypothetical protein
MNERDEKVKRAVRDVACNGGNRDKTQLNNI